MSFHEIMGLTPTPIATKTATGQQSEQGSSISSYAMSFFKGLQERAGLFVKSLRGRVTDLCTRVEEDLTVTALKTHYRRMLNTPLDSDDPTDTYETRLASLGAFIHDESMKANRALANLFYRTRAELLNRILGEGKTEIEATTVSADEGLGEASGKIDKVDHLVIAGSAQKIETPQDIIASDIEQLKARTTVQKVWDFVCGSDAKQALSLHSKNMKKLDENRKELERTLRPKHEKVIRSLHDLETVLRTRQLHPTEFILKLNAMKDDIKEFLEDGNPFQTKTREAIRIASQRILSSESLSWNDRFDCQRALSKLLNRTSPDSSRSPTPPTVLDSDSDGSRESPPPFIN